MNWFSVIFGEIPAYAGMTGVFYTVTPAYAGVSLRNTPHYCSPCDRYYSTLNVKFPEFANPGS